MGWASQVRSESNGSRRLTQARPAAVTASTGVPGSSGVGGAHGFARPWCRWGRSRARSRGKEGQGKARARPRRNDGGSSAGAGEGVFEELRQKTLMLERAQEAKGGQEAVLSQEVT